MGSLIHVLLNSQLKFLAMLLILSVTVSSLNSTDDQYCGNIRIPFPFGIAQNSYLNEYFSITCNETSNPPRAFLMNTTIEITDIFLDGRMRILNPVAHDCYSRRGVNHGVDVWLSLPEQFTVNNEVNKFTIVGCDSYGFASGTTLERNFTTGCTTVCDTKADIIEGSCEGSGCCQMPIPRDVWYLDMYLDSYNNYSSTRDFNNCSHGFMVEEGAFEFSADNLTNLNDVHMMPMLVDWVVGNETCEIAQRNLSSPACKSRNSKCDDASSGLGYRCSCQEGYSGNPYLANGCEDIDECKDSNLNNCESDCENVPGTYRCHCPKGYHGDGRKGKQGCYRDSSFVFKLVSGILAGVIALTFGACWLYFHLKRRKLIRMKQKFFFQNGGMLLQEKFIGRETTLDTAQIYTSSELKRATNNFHSSMILGHGGFGTVYKGILPNKKIVAIKKSKEVDPANVQQFINEVMVLSRIRHRNVVRLLGCCLETQSPLLVYEFVDNGTLYENIHDKEKSRFLTWETRLRIATEAASVFSYMHYAASTPIIHRDVKSANILLDCNFTAKVSDFGASRLVPMDQTQLSTMVQGTFGYLDPEYLQTNQLTEKSDVYSFGVVLVELLTGRRALCYNMPEDEVNLANFFLCTLGQDQLVKILDQNLVCEEHMEQLVRVAMLAKRCLYVKGDDRPTMKEVAMELEGLRTGGKETRIQVENTAQVEFFFGEISSFNDSDCSYNSSTKVEKVDTQII